MQEVLGAHNSDRDFERYLANWREVMAARIDQAVMALSAITGVHGLILAGSNGIGNPWPLSDIDILPIYKDIQASQSIDDVEAIRLDMLNQWADQGWRTGLDVGRLRFTVDELETTFASGDPDPVPLLLDDRWYYSIDKGYRGHALLDPDGLGSRLAAWFTAYRFTPEVVAHRLERSKSESRLCLGRVADRVAEGNPAAALGELLKAIQWRQICLMESWGERDNSLGRFGTRFEVAAAIHGSSGICAFFNELASLDARNVDSRLESAPPWVHERRDRSWKARLSSGESVTQLQNDQDVLRVCTIYELRNASGPPFPDWLAVPTVREIRNRAATLLEHIETQDRASQS